MLDEAIKLKFEAYLRKREKADLEQLVNTLAIFGPRSNVIHERVFKDEVAKALVHQALGLTEEELEILRGVWNEQLGDTIPLAISNPNPKPAVSLVQKEPLDSQKIQAEARMIFQNHLDSMRSLNNASGMLSVSNMLGLEPLSIEEVNQRMFDEAVGWAFRSHLKAYSALKKIDVDMLELRAMWNAKFPNFPVVGHPEYALETASKTAEEQAARHTKPSLTMPDSSLEQSQTPQQSQQPQMLPFESAKHIGSLIEKVGGGLILGACLGILGGPIGAAIGAGIGLILGLGYGVYSLVQSYNKYKAAEGIEQNVELLNSSEMPVSPKSTVQEKNVAKKDSLTPQYDTTIPQTEASPVPASDPPKEKKSFIKPN